MNFFSIFGQPIEIETVYRQRVRDRDRERVDGVVYRENLLEGIKKEKKGSISFLIVAICNRISFLLSYHFLRFEVLKLYNFLF